MDHIHPKANFKRNLMQKMGLADSQIDFYLNNCNGITNLQLLEGPVNLQKGTMSLENWLNIACQNQQEKDSYMYKHYIPHNVDLMFDKFEDFIKERYL